ncbi:MAG: hypothetical protein PHU23_03270 [Dehalococcoidales bacterium]|nr:hypothetical protein [Dehalococcoidales bacterium]
MVMDVHERCEIACEILQKTHDGDDLAPEHLYLLQNVVNGWVTKAGEEAFQIIHAQVMAGTYKKPWLCGVENLTRDHEGYVYWKGQHVEHYSHDNYEDMKRDAEDLGRRCRYLESIGVEVNCSHAIWTWEKYKPEGWDAEKLDRRQCFDNHNSR